MLPRLPLLASGFGLWEGGGLKKRKAHGQVDVAGEGAGCLAGDQP